MKTPDYLKTEEGKKVKYNKEYFTVFFLEQEATKGTPNEKELFFVYNTTFNTGCGINLYGIKIFSKKKNADKFCKQNKIQNL